MRQTIQDEKREQKKFSKTLEGLSDLGFYECKCAQGQYGFTREYVKEGYNYWETISFSEKKLYVYRQLNPWTKLFKFEMDLTNEILNDYKKILELINDIIEKDKLEPVIFG